MLLTLKIIPSPELNEVSRSVREDEFGDELKNHMENMAHTMYAHQGVGLAGVQVGDMRRILVADLGYVRTRVYGGELYYMVNPTVVEHSLEKNNMTEGCLSFPGLEEYVERPDWVVITYKTPYGEELTERFEGYEGRILLHEMDHFEGVTLHSRMSPFKRKRYRKALIKNLEKLGKTLSERAA